MLHVVASELTRLAQLRILLIWFGLMAAFALMVNAVMATVVPTASATDLPSPGVTFPTLAELESPSGIVAGLSAATPKLVAKGPSLDSTTDSELAAFCCH